MGLKGAKALAKANVEHFESPDTKICRALRVSNSNPIRCAKAEPPMLWHGRTCLGLLLESLFETELIIIYEF